MPSMKHDYMTDRNWKLDELMENAPPKKSFKGLLMWLVVTAILLIAAASAWQYLKKDHAAENQLQAVISQSGASSASPAAPTNSPSQTSS